MSRSTTDSKPFPLLLDYILRDPSQFSIDPEVRLYEMAHVPGYEFAITGRRDAEWVEVTEEFDAGMRTRMVLCLHSEVINAEKQSGGDLKKCVWNRTG